MSGDDPSATEQTDIVPFDPDQWPTRSVDRRPLSRYLAARSRPERSPRDRGMRARTNDRDRDVKPALPPERTRVKPLPGFLQHFQQPAASARDDVEAGGRQELLTLPHRGSVALAGGSGVVVVSDVGPGQAQVDYDDTVLDVTLQVTEDIEIHDGALLFVGGLWFRYECDDQDQWPQLQLLDDDGNPRMIVAVRDESFVVGRDSGDLVLPNARTLAPIHLQIMRSEDRTFLRSLAESGDTWSIVPPGAIIPITCALAVGNRLVRLHPPSPLDRHGALATPARRRRCA